MNDLQPDASPRSGMQLWYCSACTRLINPPGSEGVLGPDGNRYCPKCAPARKGSAVIEAVKHGSRSVVPAVKAQAESHRPSHAPAAHGHSHGHAADRQKPNSAVLAFALGGAVILVVAALVYALTGNKSAEPVAAAQPAPDVKSSNPAATTQPAPQPKAKETVERPAATGGLFNSLSSGKPVSSDPRVPQPAPPPQPVQPAQLQPVVQPVPTVSAPATPALSQDEFRTALNAAKEHAAASRYAPALAALKSVRERFGPADWFAAQQKSLSDLEAGVQQQLTDFTSEVDDMRNRVTKSDSLEFLLTVEREWTEKLRASSGGDAPLWILLEPVKVESAGGATLALQPDGAILASGNNPDRETITFTTRLWRREWTALRVEALPHPSLSDAGPGRAGNGNIALSKIRVLAKEESSPDAPISIPLSNASVDFAQGGSDAAHVLDEDPNSHWAFVDQRGRAHVLIVRPGALPPGSGPWLVTLVLDYQTPHIQHVIGHMRFSASSHTPPPAASEARAFETPKSYGADPLVQKPVSILLKAIDERRAVLLQAAEARRLAEFTQQIDALERQAKSKLTKLETVLKALDTLETQLPDSQEIALPFLDRLIAIRFDALNAKDGELSLFEANTRVMGGGAEIAYDFSNESQYYAWTPDIPDGGGGVSYDAKAGNVRLSVFNKRNWDNEDRRNAPIFRLPFLFDMNNWVFEAAVSLVDDKRPANKTQLGILMWDGRYCARLYIRENSAKDIALQLAHSHPNQNVLSRPTMMPGSIRDTYWLNMTSINGQVAFSARNAAGKVAVLSVGREKLNFEPKFFGIFLRSDDDNEIATATIDNVRFTGQPLRDKIKEAHQARRINFIQQYKENWFRARAEPPYEIAEREGRLGAEWHRLWKQSGGASVGNHNGRDNVWISHPHCVGRPFIWRRKVNLEAGKNAVLRFEISGARDFQLAVRVNDQELLGKVITDRNWQAIEVPLSRFAGQTVQIELQNQCGGTHHWQEEYAYWDKLQILSQ